MLPLSSGPPQRRALPVSAPPSPSHNRQSVTSHSPPISVINWTPQVSHRSASTGSTKVRINQPPPTTPSNLQYRLSFRPSYLTKGREPEPYDTIRWSQLHGLWSQSTSPAAGSPSHCSSTSTCTRRNPPPPVAQQARRCHVQTTQQASLHEKPGGSHSRESPHQQYLQPPGPGVSRGPTPQSRALLLTPRLALSATGQQRGSHSAAQPGNPRAGGRGPTRPLIAPPARPTANRRPQRPQTQPAPSPKRAHRAAAHRTAPRSHSHSYVQAAQRSTPAESAGKDLGNNGGNRRGAVLNDHQTGPPLNPPGKWRRRRRRHPLQSGTSRKPAACARGPPTRCATRPTASTAFLLSAAAATDCFDRSRGSTSAGAPPLHHHQGSSVLTGEMVKKGPSLNEASQTAGHLAGWIAPPPSSLKGL
ncbi:hypothetical protein NDU88_002131 [Pleurodeles waltl]|uniref:Uncharacterized protein n=1 Tax=Pleurodeles waltl TaxID=8319 RepID=A0AAV7M0M4_PLEWA|nr:hypothetical protein NDU88_002131 [Pleurodeles waltl]